MGKPYEITVVIEVPAAVWLSAARGGCQESLGMALQACRTDLLRIAANELPPNLWSKGDVLDIVQETFLEASRDFPKFGGCSVAEWRAWLRQIFRNNLRHHVRRYRGTAKRSVDHEVSLDQMDPWAVLGGVAAEDASSPSIHAMKKEQQQQVATAMAQLSERDQRVLGMRCLERCTFEAIGDALGCSPTAAHKAWRKALDRLRVELDLSSMIR